MVKKLRRKKKRQLFARERDAKLKDELVQLLHSPDYKLWLEKRRQLVEEESERAHEESIRLNDEWQRREEDAQRRFLEEKSRREEQKLTEVFRTASVELTVKSKFLTPTI